MSRRIQGFNWSDSLGPIVTWPQSLITSVNIVLESPIPMVMLWGNDGILLYNDAYSLFAGKRHPALLGLKVVDGWPEVADFNRNVLEKVLQGRTLEYTNQQLTLHRNNVPEGVWMDLTYSPITDESGKPGGVLAVVVDTTERVRAEQNRQQSEDLLRSERERLQSLFVQAPAIIAILRGPDHTFELANPLYLKLVGRKSLVGKTIREAFPELIEQGFIQILDTVYKSGKPYHGNEVPVELMNAKKRKVLHYLNFVYQPSFNVEGSVDSIMVHAVDVTDQVVARQQVEEIAAINKTIIDNATTGLLIMDTKHHCTYMNPAAEKITGYTLKQLSQGKTLHDIVHYKKPDGTPYPLKQCPTSRALARKRTVHAEDYFVREDGSMYPVAIMSTPIIQDGTLIGILEEVRDITPEKEAEAKVIKMTKELETRVASRTRQLTAANRELGRSNEELEDFAYVASHDLQEPLRKIAAFANLLEADYKALLPTEAHSYLKGMQKSSTRMRTLISDLLTFSRVTTKARPFVTVSLNEMAKEAIEDLQSSISETKADISIGKLGVIVGDSLQIRLLLQNLLSNAIKYAREGVAPKITVTSNIVGNDRIIAVKDNGIGFDVQYLDRIFIIFQRLHGRSDYDGTGVGLAICKKIVDRHGGSITAESTIGKGSTFIVTLPIRQEKQYE